MRHNRSLEAPALKELLGVMATNGRPLTRLAMRLLMLTSVRTAELRSATWKEFDLDKAEWTIAGERMKMRRSHSVPLSLQAMEVLREVQALHTTHGSDDLLFPHVREASKPMSNATINSLLKRAGFNKDTCPSAWHPRHLQYLGARERIQPAGRGASVITRREEHGETRL
ncbi:tyrosine-type recombinase/integrase [Caballeronia sp. SEWSISQ10-4 2]|uniref:tyrosine-type recombinase/integrase n=1 Tax=Caballeronia sp. SEWSISQ10-4 2 TaxID=2937438 RepID=UPI003462267F